MTTEMKAKIISKKLVDFIASPTGKAYEIEDSWGNKYYEDFWPDMPEEYQREFAEMQAVAAQSQIAMPAIDKFLFAKKHGVGYSRVFRVGGTTLAIRRA